MIKTSNLRERTRANRATARIRRNGGGTLAEHCVAQGLRRKQAKSVSGTLRDKAKDLGIEGVADTFFRGGEKHEGKRYTEVEVAQMALIYKPRLELYKLAAAELRRKAN